MAIDFGLPFRAPEVNPITYKAHAIPFLNPINMYGRVFFFSWFGFFVAFWSWYAFPPLLHDTIQKDLKLTKVDVANSNIIALSATLLVRLIAGPCCDRFGPRWTFTGCLVLGAIPTFLAGTAYTKSQLFAVRFFVGILGGSFVPCQVWSTGFFDKNVVGTANAFTAGFGNAGGGVTYFLMPSIYDSLLGDGLTPHTAWRVAFVVPGIVILAVAVGLLVLCQDTPIGKWSDRHRAAESHLAAHGVQATIVDRPSVSIADKPPSVSSGSGIPPAGEKVQYDATAERKMSVYADHEAQMTEQQMLDTARGEIVVKPTPREVVKAMFAPQTLVLAFCYFCSFGAELAINSILGTYYQKNFKQLGQTTSGQWAAMFGLLNVVYRPAGGIFADLLFKRFHNVWVKKIWIHTLGIVTGVFLIAIGILDPHDTSTMFGLIAGMAFFLEAGNGANFALVPHVSPHANGVVSGMAGAMGNFGGIIFAIVFRYLKTDYGKSFWIIGVITIAINVAVCWIPPVSKKQIGGR
ncbi:MFS transporter, NNP family, nitrate/nitrite transporter [Cladophialophora psammophila CBS 110553]|uniref:Nitrate/nitrite transporter n=1 Tax=Cladophialophora psammophila CBS 110553 TaxID=1182543 RepID=W9WWD7_9EURO|nr:MFS transporter, NNP family, nitrate/nitrite transporter [Cladophialophora psammophila CBS 110553]EXJ72522.1 MFS transporter, NNP family, nitrate/nitrite transporter [Cladophialophora psammophila CBS 110553]